MAGHSKFANIKHRKEKNDAIRGKIFTIIGREISVAVKSGGSDINTNSKLRDAVAKAKANNMPNDTIERSIKRASGNLEGVNYEEIVYEGYGPKGVAIIVETLTDNKNRTAANVRSYFTKCSGNMGTNGCVSFLFEKNGQIIIERENNLDENKLMDICIDYGALEINEEKEFFEIITTPSEFSNLYEELEKLNFKIGNAEVGLFPTNYVKLENDEDIKKMDKLLTLFEQDDDIKNVFHNWEQD